ncbi:homeodomain-interacting protein kinase 2-like [Melanotaenia boesemani]|uniref:homeodomain-interacting protein kinase 2-like n=1 Tax=Melanotaenia boesemani TaxID=1250792 RepID=UPI001C05A5AF|nr:homeodomain-interacting protein kinase 2-like [Melanotaenia boesemani]
MDEEPQPILGSFASPSSIYLIHSFIGEGTFGKVAECSKTATKEIVAVKIIKTSHVTTDARNEVDTLMRLRAFDPDRHNFVRCNDAFIYRDHVCIDFEKLDMSLLDFMYKRPERSLTVKEIRPILHQVAVTLALLQTQGIVHTDLKPDNIMLVDHRKHPLKIKVIDFGLALSESLSRECFLLQALAYRSPEVILGLPWTSAIDMWSLGCIAAELFLGNILFPASSEYNMLQHIIQTQGQIPQKLLKDGLCTETFFRQKRARRKGCRRQWVLKTPDEYGSDTETDVNSKSLDDLLTINPPCHLSDEDNEAELEDREDFVELLKQMLHVDANKRITPSQLLQDPFMTMRYQQNNYPNSFYFKSCCEAMEVCRGQVLHTSPQDEAPAWLSQWEHPLIEETASSFSSSLSFVENNEAPQQWNLSSSDMKRLLSDSQSTTSEEVSHSLELLLRSKK